jgi:predicted nucleic acid-binding protein
MNLLDTGIIIKMLRARRQCQGVISIITFAEILRGVGDEKRPVLRRLLEESFVVLALDGAVVEKYCDLYGSLQKKGFLLPDADLFIAATAMAHDLTLETTDDHFQRLKPIGLKLA